MARPRLVLADDHPETAALLRDVLEFDFEIVARARCGTGLVSAVEEWSPDAIVTDISMPRLDGLAAAAIILRRKPASRIVLVTVHNDASLVARAFAMGVLGYVLKLEAGEDLVPAVHAALRGERYVSQGLVDPERHTWPSCEPDESAFLASK